MICHNSELIDLAMYKPSNLDELQKIKGFGKQKSERFGEDILAILNRVGSTGTIMEFKSSSNVVGTISITGSNTAYNTSSDYRLKEDFKEINGLDKVSAIKVYDFKWKGSEERMDGVIAHELQEIMPYAVNGEKDGEKMQGVDYSKLVPVLVKAIQELKAEIDELKNK